MNNPTLNALGQHALRSQTIVTHPLPDDLPLEQLLAAAFVSAANTRMRLEREKQIEENRSEDILPHYFFSFQQDIVAHSVLNLVVCAYQHVGWPHTRIVGATLVIAREPYNVPLGRGETQLQFPTMASAVSDGETVEDNLVGHHGGGYSQRPVATG